MDRFQQRLVFLKAPVIDQNLLTAHCVNCTLYLEAKSSLWPFYFG